MKKSVILSAIALAALTGCVNEEIGSEVVKEQKVKIAFEAPFTHSGTRANVYGEIGSHTYDGTTTVYSYPREENFVIYAVQHDGDFAGWDAANEYDFNGKAISWDVMVDGWAPKDADGDYYYWPAGKMSFAAYSPADLEVEGVSVTYGAAGLAIENFAVNENPAKQYDLLFAERAVNQTANNMKQGADYYSGIPIQFKHALSSVHFSIKSELSDETVELNKIEVRNVKNAGSFAENIVENASDYTEYTVGGNVNPEWTEESTVDTYIPFTGTVTFPLSATYVSAAVNSELNVDNTDDASHSLLLLPQELDDAAEIYVEYTIGDTKQSKTVQLNTYDVKEWLIGYKYTYRLVVSKETVDKDRIYFSPSTDEWLDGGIIEIRL